VREGDDKIDVRRRSSLGDVKKGSDDSFNPYHTTNENVEMETHSTHSSDSEDEIDQSNEANESSMIRENQPTKRITSWRLNEGIPNRYCFCCFLFVLDPFCT
jgi:hypothetical protein